MEFEIIRVPECPETLINTLNDPGHPLGAAWPRFTYESAVSRRCLRIQQEDPGLSRWIFLTIAKCGVEGISEFKTHVVAVGSSVPIYWATPEDSSTLPDSGWEWALAAGVDLHLRQDPDKPQPNALCGLEVTVDPAYRYKVTGRDLASEMIMKMKGAASEAGFAAMIIPVRPSLKGEGANIWMDMSAYCSLGKGEGTEATRHSDHVYEGLPKGREPYDPWIRKHTRLGGRVVKICLLSFVVEGTIEEWKEWTGVDFDRPSVRPGLEQGWRKVDSRDSYEVLIPGALVPVRVDRQKNLGSYVEPNIWIRHL